MILKKKLGEILLESKLLTEEHLEQVLTESKKVGLRLGQYITRHGLLNENQIIDVLSRQLKIEKYYPDKYPLDMNLASLFPIEIAKKFHVAPLRQNGRLLTIAMTDPQDINALDNIEATTNCEVDPVICTEKEINQLISDIYYGGQSGETEPEANMVINNAPSPLRQTYPENSTEIQGDINNTDKEIDQMSGLEFENLVSSLFIKMGFDVTVTKQTADGGIDLIVYNNQPLLESTYIVQCKRWSSSIGEPVVRDLYGVVTAERANKGILITNSNYTNSAINFAQGKPIELIDGLMLVDLLEKYDLMPKRCISDGTGSSSFLGFEDTELKEELSTILNIVRKDPTNVNLRIKLAYKQIDSVWSGNFSRNFILKMIRDAEDNLNYLSNINYNANDKVSNFIRHMSFHQLGYLKVSRGQIAEGIQYYLKAIEINSFSKKSLKDPYYDDHGKYNWHLNDFFIQNLLNVITLSNYLGASRLAQKILSKYKHRVDKYIQQLFESKEKRTNPYFNFLREEWMNRTIYVLNYWEDKYDSEDIIEEAGSDPNDDVYDYNGVFPKDLAHVFDYFNKYQRIFSISDEEKSHQRKIVDAIT